MGAKSATADRKDHLASLPVKLSGERFLRRIWPRIFKKKAKVFFERLTYGIRDHGVVGKSKETGDIGILYFPRRESGEVELLPFWKLFEEGANSDYTKKWAILICSTVELLMPAIALGVHCGVHALHPKYLETEAYLYGLMAVAAAGLLIALAISSILRNHFITMDTTWQTSFQRMLAADLQTKMFGIKGSVSSYRHFVKWRRLMTHFLIAAGFYFFLIQFPLLVWALLPFGTTVRLGLADWPLLAILAIQCGCILRISYLVWYFTGVRDPTAQLCVTLVETDRDVVAAMRANNGN